MKLVASTAAALFLTAGAAHADFFSVTSEGTMEIVGSVPPIFETFNAETVTSVVGPYDFVEWAGTAFLDASESPAAATGELTWTDSSGDTLVMSIEGLVFGDPESYSTAAGTWTMLSGTGVYADLVGNGAWNRTFLSTAPGLYETTSNFGGTLVPAPGVLALLGVGAMATRRRRR